MVKTYKIFRQNKEIFQWYFRIMLPHLNVYENLAFPLKQLKFKKKQIQSKISENCNIIDLREFLERFPDEISGGKNKELL